MPSTPSGTNLPEFPWPRAVTVFAIALHGSQAAHSAIFFKTTAFIQDYFTRSFFQGCQQTAQHHQIGAARDRFDDITGIFDAAIGNDRDIKWTRSTGAVINGSHLGHARA